MILKAEELYHIYNQGNNRLKIFFTRDNYLFFLKKIRQHILPHADILAWCLMPNHFHLMIYVHTLEITIPLAKSDGLTSSEAVTKRSLNDSIGLLLRSYTRAINKQRQMSGSIFRNTTHAECLTETEGSSPTFFNTSHGTRIAVYLPEKEYPQVCFNYIHSDIYDFRKLICDYI
jgi:putative transposase